MIAIPQPHAAMHRGGVHLLAECHQPSLENGARKGGSAAATCMIRHTFTEGTLQRISPDLRFITHLPDLVGIPKELLVGIPKELFLVHRIW